MLSLHVFHFRGVIEVAGLVTQRPLDFETEPQYVFQVRATDGDGNVSVLAWLNTMVFT